MMIDIDEEALNVGEDAAARFPSSLSLWMSYFSVL